MCPSPVVCEIRLAKAVSYSSVAPALPPVPGRKKRIDSSDVCAHSLGAQGEHGRGEDGSTRRSVMSDSDNDRKSVG